MNYMHLQKKIWDSKRGREGGREGRKRRWGKNAPKKPVPAS